MTEEEEQEEEQEEEAALLDPAVAPHASGDRVRQVWDVFISHTRVDQAWALWLARLLEDAGYSVWLAEERLQPGDSLLEKIDEAIEASRFFLLLGSEQAAISRTVASEVEAATKLGKPVVWTRVDPSAKLPPRWEGQILDLAEKPLPDAASSVLSFLREGSEKKFIATAREEHPAPLAPTPFVDREAEAVVVHETFARAQAAGTTAAVVITGPGGSGKTALAAHFVDENQAQFSEVIWCDRSIDELDSMLERIPPDALLVIDDVDDLASALEAARSAHAHLLATSRAATALQTAPRATEAVQLISLPRLTTEASIRLLSHNAPELDPDVAVEIAQAMEGLPLALMFAAQIIRQRGIDGRTFVDEVRALRALADQPSSRGVYYLDTDDPRAISEFERALLDIVGEGTGDVELLPPEIRSWKAWWRSRYTPERVDRFADKAERAAEVMGLSRPEGEANLANAEAIARLLESSASIPNIVINSGSVLMIKITDARGPRVYSKTLTATELRRFEENQQLLADPQRALELLQLLGTGDPPAALGG